MPTQLRAFPVVLPSFASLTGLTALDFAHNFGLKIEGAELLAEAILSRTVTPRLLTLDLDGTPLPLRQLDGSCDHAPTSIDLSNRKLRAQCAIVIARLVP